MTNFRVGDRVHAPGMEWLGEGVVVNIEEVWRGKYDVGVRFDNFEGYDDSDGEDFHGFREESLKKTVEPKGLASEEELLAIQDRLDSPDDVNPTHYSGDLVMRVIEERGLDFALGNTVKYVCRAGSKGDKLTDLKKGLWYLQRAIEREEAR